MLRTCHVSLALLAFAASSAMGQKAGMPAPTRIIISDEGADGVSRPDAAGRVVKVFSFEEKQTNPGDVPQNWYRSYDTPDRPRPGFPAWNKAALSYTTEGGVAFGGVGSVMLPTRGGSTALVVGDGVLPVFQNADYLISAKVRTDHLTHARAAMVARFLDKSGVPIPNSDIRTALVMTNGAWQDVSVELVGEFDQAAYIQIELELLQPEQFDPKRAEKSVKAEKGPEKAVEKGTEKGGAAAPKEPVPDVDAYRIWSQDITGAAWFDDVAVVQLPRVELRTTSPNNIVSAPDQPELKMLVRDLTGESLAIRVAVLDVNGQVADHLSRKIGAGFTSTTWKPSLSRLGWYRATMEITTSSGGLVGRSYADFIWVPGEGASPDPHAQWSAVWGDRRRFGLVFDDLPGPMLANVADLAHRIGSGMVTLPVWERDLTEDSVVARSDALRPVVDALYRDRQQLTLSLPHVPTELAQRVQATPGLEEDDPWTLLAGDAKFWLPFAGPFFERFGQRVNHWQVGAAGDDRAYWRKDVKKEFGEVTDALARQVPGPVIAIPMRAGRQWPGSGKTLGIPPALVETVTPDTTAQAVGLAARAWGQSGAGEQSEEMSLLFQAFPPARYGMSAGAAETAKRAVEFWAALSEVEVHAEYGAMSEEAGRKPDLPGASMSLEEPWDWTKGRRPQLMPRPELAVWRCLRDRLVGRRIVGSLPVSDGVVCYILAPAPGAPASRGGALVAWNVSAQPQDAVLGVDLGDNPVRAVDIFGNSEAIAPAQAAATNGGRAAGQGVRATRALTHIQLTSSPVFIEGVDVPLLRFVAAIAVDPPYLESSNDEHDRDITISNPWQTGITGRVTILEPGGFESGQKDRTWHISPRTMRFSVPAGKTERLPIKVSFSPVEEVGPRDFVMAVELSADQPYGTLEVRRPVEVGVKSISLDLAASAQGKDGQDLVVEAMVSNTGQHLLTLEITAFAEGFPRSKASVTGLTPGNQTVKRFVYPGAAPRLRGQRVVLSVFDPDTKMRVNKSILIK